MSATSDCLSAIGLRWNAASRRVCFRPCPSNPSGGRVPPDAAQPRRSSALHTIALLLTLTFTPPLRAAESAEPARLAAQALLLAVTQAGKNLVVVGDRGHILLSKDEGKSWTQCPVPTRAMLTGVSFPDAQHGWVVGHDGVILNTTDGGQTWLRQDPGTELETIYLDVLFLDPQRGFAVGAYGKFISTNDGGKTWQTSNPSPNDIHYNRLTASSSGRLFLSGESGSLLLSSDAGRSWQPSAVPYDGSLFGYVPVDEASGIVHGLRGHIFTTNDHGATWAPHHSDIKALIMGGTRLRSGVIVLGGQGGNFFISRDQGNTFSHWKPLDFSGSVSALIETNDGAIVAVGEAGAVRLSLPNP